MIADTTLLIDILRGDPDAREMIERQSNLLVTTPSITEIFAGLHNASSSERNKIERILGSLNALPLDIEAAKRAGKIRSTLKQEGKPIDIVDCMIAGIALTHGKAVITRNDKHFGRIAELDCVTY